MHTVCYANNNIQLFLEKKRRKKELGNGKRGSRKVSEKLGFENVNLSLFVVVFFF